jgi:hypothetical protein
VKSSPSSSLDISINTISFICIDFAGLPVLPGPLERPLLQRLLNAHVWSQAASDREVPPEVVERRVQIVLAGDKLPQHWSHRNIHARQAGRNFQWVDPAKGNVVPRSQVRQLEEVPRRPDVVVLEPVPVIFVSAFGSVFMELCTIRSVPNRSMVGQFDTGLRVPQRGA